MNRYANEPIYSRYMAEKSNSDAGFYFFERDTMRFFRSRISENFYPCDARKCSYFVTSEANRGAFGELRNPRLYTVRAIEWAGDSPGDVRTVSKFQEYRTNGAAQRAAKAYSEGRPEPTKEGAAVVAANQEAKAEG